MRQQRLLKSILPSGTSAGPGDFTRLYGKGSVTVAVGSDLEYAVYVHEAMKPAEGEMYAVGTRGPGWSKPGSGNKYLDRPWDETEEATFRELERNLDAALKATADAIAAEAVRLEAEILRIVEDKIKK